MLVPTSCQHGPLAYVTQRPCVAGYSTGLALVYDANPEVWEHVQCTSVSDSCSTTRACCACSESFFCPFKVEDGWSDSGYCHAPCNAGDAEGQTKCKQLAAGCGVSVFDATTNWGWDRCSERQVLDGDCDLCEEPLWCDDPSDFGFAGSVNGPEDWLDQFYRKDMGRAVGSRQCKFKNSQARLPRPAPALNLLGHSLQRHVYPWVFCSA